MPVPFTMAFQPIVDVTDGSIYAYEALARGSNNEPAASIFSQITEEHMYAFDQACRVKAITLASRLGLMDTTAKLSINFLPRAIYSPVACLQLTLRTARETGISMERLIFEVVEREEVLDRTHLKNIAAEYRRQGLGIALDDFGAGFSGLNLLADLLPDVLKLDMDLIRNLPLRPTSLVIVGHMVALASDLGMLLVAEGVETLAEYRALRKAGVRFMQGNLLAAPAFEAFPQVRLPEELDVIESGPLHLAAAQERTLLPIVA